MALAEQVGLEQLRLERRHWEHDSLCSSAAEGSIEAWDLIPLSVEAAQIPAELAEEHTAAVERVAVRAVAIDCTHLN